MWRRARVRRSTRSLKCAATHLRCRKRHPLVVAFQSAYAAVTGGALPPGDKPFVDDGNQFAAFGIPAITHGPAGTGAHTLHESVPLSELVRVAQVYALAAVAYLH